MNIKITPSRLCGSVTLPPSKSGLHRAIICGGLAKGKSMITPAVLSDDITATIGAMRTLGSKISVSQVIDIEGINSSIDTVTINAGESGSTLRFLIPIAAALAKSAAFMGQGRLPYRPLTPYFEILNSYEKGENELPLTVYNGFKGNEFNVPGNISSQFITGILLAMPLIKEKTRLNVTDRLESRPYVDITMDVMRKFGVTVTHNNYKSFETTGDYMPCDYKAEQDWSAAAFWLVAGCIGNRVLCEGLSPDTKQGDSEICKIIENCGGKINIGSSGISSDASVLSGISVDVCDIPDLVPVLAVLGCFCEGEFEIINASRLRLKESDRLLSISEGLIKMGADINVSDDKMTIRGKQSLKGGCTVSSFNDHRIAMSLSVAATMCENPVIITGAECISKSYPDFFIDYNRIGGKAYELDLG